jgi:hypothetical protein
MSLTRRRFVHAASLSLLAGAAIPPALAQALSNPQDPAFSAENLNAFNGISIGTFKPLVGESFAATSSHHVGSSLTLISVREGVTPSPDPVTPATVGPVARPAPQPLTGFTLRFEGAGPDLPQDTYILRNRSLGSISLFLVPSGPGTSPTTYTAVFNQLP